MERMIFVLLGTLVVMFWNVENFFDPFDDPLKNDNEFTAVAERHWTWARFERKRDGIAQAILAAGDAAGDLPALVGLAEVENRLTMSQLVRRTPLEELGYGFVHRESPDERGIDVALLYRKDRLRLLAVDSLRVPGITTRDILYVKLLDRNNFDNNQPGSEEDPAAFIEVEQTRFRSASFFSASGTKPRSATEPQGEVFPGIYHVFVTHLPSKRGGARASDSRREAALRVLQGAVDSLLALDEDSRIIVMGDFNAEDCAVAGLAEPPLTADSATPGTLKYHGRWERIDHFFLSPALKGRQQIFAPAFLLEPDVAWLGVKPRRTYIGPRHNGGLSDHLPIILQINP